MIIKRINAIRFAGGAVGDQGAPRQITPTPNPALQRSGEDRSPPPLCGDQAGRWSRGGACPARSGQRRRWTGARRRGVAKKPTFPLWTSVPLSSRLPEAAQQHPGSVDLQNSAGKVLQGSRMLNAAAALQQDGSAEIVLCPMSAGWRENSVPVRLSSSPSRRALRQEPLRATSGKNASPLRKKPALR